MCRYLCIGFIDFMVRGKSLLDYTNLFSPNDDEWSNNTKIFSITKKMKKLFWVICGIENLKNLKYYPS